MLNNTEYMNYLLSPNVEKAREIREKIEKIRKKDKIELIEKLCVLLNEHVKTKSVVRKRKTFTDEEIEFYKQIDVYYLDYDEAIAVRKQKEYISLQRLAYDYYARLSNKQIKYVDKLINDTEPSPYMLFKYYDEAKKQ